MELHVSYRSCTVFNTLRFKLSVCVCVCDGCGRGRYEFAGRVQKHHVRFSFHRNGHIKIFLEIVKAAALLVGTLWVAEGWHCRRLPSHYRRARVQD